MVAELTEAGCLVEQEAVDNLSPTHVSRIRNLSPRPMVVDEQLVENLSSDEFIDDSERSDIRTSVEVLTEIDTEKEKRDVQDFVNYYNNRYEQIKNLLLRRRDIQRAVSISRLEQMGEQEDVSVVGMVTDKYKTRKGKFIVYVEDPTGETKLLVSEEDGERIVQDEVIGVNGVTGDDIVFADDVIWPDIPLPDGISETKEEVYAAFLSDIHFGSIDTLNDVADDFIDWLHADSPVTDRIKYLFIVGDAVEGVGTYPGQEEELQVTNIYKQYDIFVEFVERIPDDIEVIIGPGNHDMVRLAEPQPPLPREAVEALYEMDNVHMVPNPCYVRVHGHDNDGILVLMYHGYSFDEHVSTLPHLREHAYEEPDRAMVDWLKRRHLAPIYGSNLLVPREEDLMVIDPVPDILTMGHTHSFACTTYKGVNLVCAGTFQDQTDFQKRVGHKPDPGKVALINLQTREHTVKEFDHG